MEKDQITRLLGEWQAGDGDALEQLTPFVYAELQKLAASHMRKERGSHTLQPTALVNEAFLKILGSQIDFASRVHFYGIASRVMRRILVEHARYNNRQKRGGGVEKVTLHESLLGSDNREADMVELDAALNKLAEFDARMAKAIELLYFGGLTHEETAEVIGISRTTLFEDLKLAKAWLNKELQ